MKLHHARKAEILWPDGTKSFPVEEGNPELEKARKTEGAEVWWWYNYNSGCTEFPTTPITLATRSQKTAQEIYREQTGKESSYWSEGGWIDYEEYIEWLESRVESEAQRMQDIGILTQDLPQKLEQANNGSCECASGEDCGQCLCISRAIEAIHAIQEIAFNQ